MYMKILMCRPEFYGIEYEINPWMNVEKKVEHRAAVHQWENLHKTILNCGATVDLVEPVKGCPDMVFTANACLLYQNKIILAHFKYKERQGEQYYFQQWFNENGYEVINPNEKTYFEGAGDALSAGNTLFVGHGFRTDRQFYEHADFLDQTLLVYCELNNPYFYHLDTCFCPINDNLAIWYPDAFTKESQDQMKKRINLIAVNEYEAKRFACNAVVLDNHVILPTDCPEITTELEKHGLTVHACEMAEFLKAGGACKCLTLRLD